MGSFLVDLQYIKLLNQALPIVTTFQTFDICSIDSCQKLDLTGKFGDLLSAKSGSDLVDLLTLPVAPYRQNDLDHPVTSQQPGKAFSDHKRIARELQVSNLDASECASQTQIPRPCIAELPLEILGTIFSQLDPVSILRLLVVARVFWDIGWYYLERSVMGCMAPWARQRIICVGEDVHRHDNPIGLLTEEEEEVLDRGIPWVGDDKNDEDDEDTEDYEDDDNDEDDNIVRYRSLVQPATLFLVVDSSFCAVDTKIRPHSKLLQTAIEELNHLPEAYKKKALEFALTSDLSQYFLPEETWLLRNLTSKELVYAQRLREAFQETKKVLDRIWASQASAR